MRAEGIDPATAGTFRDLLEAELAAKQRARFVPAPHPCPDVPCAQAAGGQLGAETVVFGMLRPLGSKILAYVTVVDTRSGEVLASENLSVERVEELDSLAKRLATSLLSGAPATDTAELGTVTPQEAKPDRRRSVDTNALLRIGPVLPLTKEAYGGLGTGIALDLGLWIETRRVAIEPRIGLRFDVAGEDSSSFFEFPLDIGASYLFSDGDISPLVGGGLGMHYLRETRWRENEQGRYIVAEGRGEAVDSGWGLGLYGRAGILFLRTYKVRLALTGDYNVNFIELNQGSKAQSVVLGLGIIL